MFVRCCEDVEPQTRNSLSTGSLLQLSGTQPNTPHSQSHQRKVWKKEYFLLMCLKTSDPWRHCFLIYSRGFIAFKRNVYFSLDVCGQRTGPCLCRHVGVHPKTSLSTYHKSNFFKSWTVVNNKHSRSDYFFLYNKKRLFVSYPVIFYKDSSCKVERA